VPAGVPRLGITVTRKVGNAVRRNRIKRLVREWFRTAESALGAYDVVVIAKRDIPETLGAAEARADLDRGLRRFHERGDPGEGRQARSGEENH